MDDKKEDFYYKIRCDKHQFKSYEYCEMCVLRMHLQNQIDENYNLIRNMVADTHLAIKVLNECFDKLDKRVDLLIEDYKKRNSK